jgi:glycosyltransferase involved in cell wall biosynthesis
VLWNETWYWPLTLPRSLVWIFVKLMMLKAEATIVSGSKAREFIISNCAYPSRVFIAPNASNVIIDKDLISYEQELKKKLGLEGKKVILYLGRLIERKGVPILIKAFSKLQSDVNASFLVIVGEGEDRINLEKLCAELKLNNVIFTGYVDDKYKGLYYSLADVFVLPSTKHTGEVWDLVLNEAMTFAKPIVTTTAAGSSYDLVKNSVNGFIVKEGDEHALYNAIKTLLKDPEKAKKMGLESKKIIEERFSTGHMTEGFIRAISYVTNLHYRK